MIRMAVTDMDGTFLRPDGSMNRDLARRVLARCREASIAFVACTGKQCERVEELFEGVTEDLWVLGDSATRIRHGGATVWSQGIEAGLAHRIMDFLTELHVDQTVVVCTEGAAHVLQSEPQEIRDALRRSYRHVVPVTGWAEVTEEVLKITVFDPAGRSTATLHALRELVGEQVYAVDSEKQWLDVTAAGVDKGTTLGRLQERLGTDPAHTLAFGDTLNDLPLMRQAAFSVSVANAYPELKAVTRFGIGPNSEDAVLHALEAFAAAQLPEPAADAR